MATYQFPLVDQDRYPAAITFTVVKTTGVGLSVDTVQTSQGTKSLDNAGEGFAAAFGTALDIGKSVWNAQLQAPQQSTGDSIKLYMPAGVQVQDGVIFDNTDFGIRGASGMAGLPAAEGGTLGGAAAAVANPLSSINALTDAFQNAPNKGQAAAVAASFLAQKAGQTTGAIVSSALQVTTNPNTRAVFKTVPIREFTFSFKMLPQSQREAEQMVKIVDMFRTEVYPEVYSVEGVPIGYKFPNKFNIKLDYGGQDVGILILPCYLVTMNTTYNGSSQSFYRDGKFSEIDLTVTMRESRTLSRQDITNGVSTFGKTNPGSSTFLARTSSAVSNLTNAANDIQRGINDVKKAINGIRNFFNRF